MSWRLLLLVVVVSVLSYEFSRRRRPREWSLADRCVEIRLSRDCTIAIRYDQIASIVRIKGPRCGPNVDIKLHEPIAIPKPKASGLSASRFHMIVTDPDLFVEAISARRGSSS
jgi:hypothetical protein